MPLALSCSKQVKLARTLLKEGFERRCFLVLVKSRKKNEVCKLKRSIALSQTIPGFNALVQPW